MKVLRLVRDTPGPAPYDATGTVADAAVFPDGLAILHWRTAPAGTEVYQSEADMRLVRERSGRSHFEEAPREAEAAFLAASAAVWREIDRLDSRPGGYHPTAMDVDLRRRERAAWECYRRALDREGQADGPVAD